MKHKIVLCTAGGAIASFHAAFKSMYDTLEKKAPGRFELVGALGGLSGLAQGRFLPIRPETICPDRGGSMIGADREIAETNRIIASVKDADVYAVIMMGGDNHLNEAARCHDAGIHVVGYPKTMDGDLSSFLTLGWETAVTTGARAVRWHHHTAMTYDRVFFVGLFGRNTDWVTAAVTAYGGGDLGIPCEKEYDWADILERIKAAYTRNAARYGRGFAVVPYSEGARIQGVDPPPTNHCSLDKHGLPKLQPEWLGLELVRLCKEAKLSAAFQTHTYDMRDYPPTETDKTLSAMAGEKCMEMVLKGDFGKSVVFEPKDDFYAVDTAPLNQVAVQRKLSDTDYFDYQNLKTNASFIRDYGNLFRPSLGDPPNKEALVYPCMLGPF